MKRLIAILLGFGLLMSLVIIFTLKSNAVAQSEPLPTKQMSTAY